MALDQNSRVGDFPLVNLCFYYPPSNSIYAFGCLTQQIWEVGSSLSGWDKRGWRGGREGLAEGRRGGDGQRRGGGEERGGEYHCWWRAPPTNQPTDKEEGQTKRLCCYFHPSAIPTLQTSLLNSQK